MNYAQDFKVNLESVLLMYYIKYDRLNELMKHVELVRDIDHIDIYIDIFNMLKKAYQPNVRPSRKLSIVSSIINLAAHYRGYFRTRYRLWTRIFLVYGNESTDNHRRFYMGFSSRNEETLNYNEIEADIRSQLELVRILCGYIEDVYCIFRNTDFSMFTYDNICKNQQTPSIVITKSKYSYQIPALTRNAYIFRPKKSKDGDVSFVIKYSNSLVKYYDNINSNLLLEKISKINPNLISIMMILSGCSERKVPSIMNTNRSVNAVLTAIHNNRILNGYNTDINYLYTMLVDIHSLITRESFELRFKALDLLFQHRLYMSQMESKDLTWLINLHDANTVKNINNQYFADNPLDLNNL